MTPLYVLLASQESSYVTGESTEQWAAMYSMTR